jgi:hypothetical protein
MFPKAYPQATGTRGDNLAGPHLRGASGGQIIEVRYGDLRSFSTVKLQNFAQMLTDLACRAQTFLVSAAALDKIQRHLSVNGRCGSLSFFAER